MTRRALALVGLLAVAAFLMGGATATVPSGGGISNFGSEVDLSEMASLSTGDVIVGDASSEPSSFTLLQTIGGVANARVSTNSPPAGRRVMLIESNDGTALSGNEDIPAGEAAFFFQDDANGDPAPHWADASENEFRIEQVWLDRTGQNSLGDGTGDNDCVQFNSLDSTTGCGVNDAARFSTSMFRQREVSGFAVQLLSGSAVASTTGCGILLETDVSPADGWASASACTTDCTEIARITLGDAAGADLKADGDFARVDTDHLASPGDIFRIRYVADESASTGTGDVCSSGGVPGGGAITLRHNIKVFAR